MRDKKVMVAMSGGVDSSLTAALLKDRGYDVIGVTMEIVPSKLKKDSPVEDAKKVADRLSIPFQTVDFTERFTKEVIDYFVSEYAQARTPNPCVICNQEIKFDALLKKGLELGAEYIATGHYARIEHNNGRYLIKKPEDLHKDQTYNLYGLTQNQLAHILMPLGEFKKEDTRKLAKEFGLEVHNKPGSQEICFVPDDDYKGYLRRNYPEIIKPGPILDTEGNKLGKHDGLPFYTIGQRRGLGLSYHKPLYVIRLDTEQNAVVVGDNKEVFGDKLIAANLNWVAISELKEPIEVETKIRYNVTPAQAVVYPVGQDKARVEFLEEQRAITPGQAVVFYQEDLLVGGGIIEREV